MPQIGIQDGNHFAQQLRRNRLAYCLQRKMGRGQRDPQLLGRQHHDHFTGVSALFEELGMAGKGDAGVVDVAFVHRPGNQRREFAIKAAIAGARQRFHHIAAILDMSTPGCTGA